MGIFQQKYITEQEDKTTAEHCLWTSVLAKAAHDAIFTSDWVEAKKAITWFKDQGSGFREVCELAGKDPNYVYSHIISKILERSSLLLKNVRVEEFLKDIALTVAEFASIKPDQILELAEMECLLSQWEALGSPLSFTQNNPFLVEISTQELEKKLRI